MHNKWYFYNYIYTDIFCRQYINRYAHGVSM